MLFADPKILSITSCVQEMGTSMGGVIGQFIAVTVRDMIAPSFANPTNPLSGDAIRMASMISGIIIAALVLLCSPIAYLTGRMQGSAPMAILQQAAIPITPANKGSESEIVVVGGIAEIEEVSTISAFESQITTDTSAGEETGNTTSSRSDVLS
eukprot:gnl/Chilomastix_caulleri/6622.p1 GENE.gnl/Chilomastix_caulleri/6622~~gnl/Chilomastix_caulleri/6622.p1  ORF type:complete len:154 (+),score=30.14 gnl/Chilomastix_caulleri/6622:148-609(+)